MHNDIDAWRLYLHKDYWRDAELDDYLTYNPDDAYRIINSPIFLSDDGQHLCAEWEVAKNPYILGQLAMLSAHKDRFLGKPVSCNYIRFIRNDGKDVARLNMYFL